jgi:hypothetical protein
MHENKNTSFHIDIDWMPTSSKRSFDIDSSNEKIEEQIKQSRSEQRCLLNEVKPGIFLLTIPEPNNNTLLTIKKVADRVQYGILPDRLNNDN